MLYFISVFITLSDFMKAILLFLLFSNRFNIRCKRQVLEFALEEDDEERSVKSDFIKSVEVNVASTDVSARGTIDITSSDEEFVSDKQSKIVIIATKRNRYFITLFIYALTYFVRKYNKLIRIFS